MFFSNRRDVDEVLETIDHTSCSKLEFSKDDLQTKIDIEINKVFPEYRYITVDDRLYFITDYKITDEVTSITGIDFITKWADTISLNKGTWHLEDVLKQINGYCEVNYPPNITDASITITETTKVSDIIQQIENDLDGFIQYETILDTHAKTSNSAYYPVANIILFSDSNINNADFVLASDEFDVETDYNPQLDLAYNLTFSVKNINTIGMLNSYQSIMSADDFNAVKVYILGSSATNDGTVTQVPDDKKLDADGASNIIKKYLTFSKRNFVKTLGTEVINNTDGINDEFSYDLGEFDFASKSTLEMYILTSLLSSYQAKEAKDKTNVSMMRQLKIIGIDGDTYYISKSYTYDYLNHTISSIKLERQ